MNEVEALLILTHIPGLGPVKIKKLINAFDSPLSVLKASSLPDWVGKSAQTFFLTWKLQRVWKKDLQLVEKRGVSLIPFFSPNYPSSLAKLSDAPPLLYLLGQLSCLQKECLAIVGTRAATFYGKEMAHTFAKQAAKKGWCVVSGLARGIDTAAHLGALETGDTVAVVGSGLDNLYPKENTALAQKIIQKGAVISEFPMEQPPSTHTFPKRNRIVSGFCKNVLLIESPKKGGAMLTMEMARKQNKGCFALPGRIDVPSFEGNFTLIKENRAKMITCPSEIVGSIPKENPKTNLSFSQEEESFLELLDGEEKSIETLVLLTQLPIMKLNVLLSRLLLKRAIKEFPGKIYKRMI